MDMVALADVGHHFADIFAMWGLYSATPEGGFIPGLEYAGVIRAEAVFERAADALRRAETAYKAGAMNDEQIEEARNRQDIAAADLQFAQEIFDKAQAQLTLPRAQFEEHTIRAPFDGIVVRVHAEAGEVLSPGEPRAELLALDRTMVDLHLPAETALGLRAGDRVALDIAVPIGAVTAARVAYAEPRVDATSKTTWVVFELKVKVQASKSTREGRMRTG